MRITDFPELVLPLGADLVVGVDVANDITKRIKLENLPVSIPTTVALATKQDLLVSGTTIKTLNSVSLLGSGNIVLTANANGVAGAVQFSDGSAFNSDASNLFWDNTNKRLGVGTNITTVGNIVTDQVTQRLYLNAVTGQYAHYIGSTVNLVTGDTSLALFGLGVTSGGYSGGIRLFTSNISITPVLAMIVDRNQNVGIGLTNSTNLTASARLHIIGSGTTSATSSLLVQNNAGTTIFTVQDDTVIRLQDGGIIKNFNGSGTYNLDLGRVIIRGGDSAPSNGALSVGTISSAAKIVFQGSGSTSATTALLVQNSIGAVSLRITDDQIVRGYADSVLRFQLGGNIQQLLSTRNGAVCIGLVDNGNTNNCMKLAVNSGTGKSLIDGWDSYDIVIGSLGSPVQIGTDSSVASAQLTINSITRGFLLPRMTTTQRDAIATPATGLKIYNTTLGTTDTYDGATWQRFGQQTFIKGSGTTSATIPFLVQNGAGTEFMRIADNGVTTFGGTVQNTSGPFAAVGFYNAQNIPFIYGTSVVYSIQGTTPVITSGQRDGFLADFTWGPTSGTASMNVFNASPTINQTGGANGITRGLYINPTLIAAADFRAIEVVRGNVLLATTSGRVGIGTDAPTQALDVVGQSRFSDNILFSTDYKYIGRDLNASSIRFSSLGNEVMVNISTGGRFAVNFPGAIRFQVSAGGQTTISGGGSTSATTALLVQNSAGVSSLQVTDDGSVFNLGKGAVTTNTVFGKSALNANTSGSNNTAIGAETLLSNTTGTGNTAIGYQALRASTGSDNTAVGLSSLQVLTNGTRNTGIGKDSGFANTNGASNVFIGWQSGYSNTTGNSNTSCGAGSLGSNSTGSDNSALGRNSSTGNFSGSVILGKDATATANNQFVVGSTGTNAGAVTTESNSSTKVWNVIINGVAQKILLA